MAAEPDGCVRPAAINSATLSALMADHGLLRRRCEYGCRLALAVGRFALAVDPAVGQCHVKGLVIVTVVRGMRYAHSWESSGATRRSRRLHLKRKEITPDGLVPRRLLTKLPESERGRRDQSARAGSHP